MIESPTLHTDQFGTTHLRSREAQQKIWLSINVRHNGNGGATVHFRESLGSEGYHADGQSRFVVSLDAGVIDELITALLPAMEHANWEATYVRVPNPKHRPGE